MTDPLALLDALGLPAIAVHGGAGTRAHTPASERAAREGVSRAAAAGYAVLRAGGPALDAAIAAVRVLEDDPAFNAGTGGALNGDGEVECDASVMDGAALSAGAVAAVRHVKNPIALARLVMDRSPHVLFAGDGAEAFAREQGVPMIENATLVTPPQRERWLELAAEAARDGADSVRKGFGTVGAVCVDARGHVAAATSTGGTPYKRPGRVGDTPIIGAGTYADDTKGAASATGLGEAILRVTLTREACDLVQSGASAREAAERAIAILAERTRAEAGVIVAAPDGRLGWAYNSRFMSRALMRDGLAEPLALL